MTHTNKNQQATIQELIKSYQSNPILPLELAQLIPKIHEDNVSVQQLKRFYHRDPIFCAYLVYLAWQASKDKQNHPTAADHAISLVGINGVQQFLEGVHKSEKTEISQEVKFLLSSSLLAGELCKNLCKDSTKESKLYWAALAHQYPDIVLWHINPKAMWQIHYHQAKVAINIQAFDEKTLGFTRAQWRLEVAKTWHMSEFNLATFEKSPPNNARELIRYSRLGFSDKTRSLEAWQNTPSWQILVANWLAKALTSPWLSNSHKHYFLIAKKAFDINEIHLKKAIATSLRTTSENLTNSSLFIPASCFLHQRQNAVYPAWLNQSGKKIVRKAVGYNLKQFVNKLHTVPEEFSSTGQLLTESFNAIIQGLGFSRVAFMSVNWNTRQVTTKVSIGVSGSTDKKSIRPEFSFKQATPLSKFLKEKAFLVFDYQRHKKFWSKLPLAIQQQNVERFALYSIMPSTRVKALIYVDGSDLVLSEPIKIKQLKIILSGISKALAKKQTLTEKAG